MHAGCGNGSERDRVRAAETNGDGGTSEGRVTWRASTAGSSQSGNVDGRRRVERRRISPAKVGLGVQERVQGLRKRAPACKDGCRGCARRRQRA
jgi:hypothetical protein